MAGAGSDYIGLGIGTQIGTSVGGMIGGFFQARAAKATAKLQAQMALGAAYSKADALRANAQQVSQLAGEQEYALYKQQQSNLDAMTVRASNNGLAMEGSNVELLSGQAKVDAQNRDALIRDSRNQQFQLLFSAQQTIAEGKNQAAYYKAMGSAQAASAIWGGIANGIGGLSNAGYNYGMASAAGYI